MTPHSALAAALLLVAQIGGGGTSTSSAVRQIERSVTRPLPAVRPPSVSAPPDVWVPDRVVPDPMRGGTVVTVPGHWERRLATGEHFAPPTAACTAVGECTTVPAGVRPAPDRRIGP